MFNSLFGSLAKEQVLIFIGARGQGYGREIAAFFDTSLTPIQRQLDNLEVGNVLYSEVVGKTRLYRFNPRYPLATELKSLLEKALLFYPPKQQEELLLNRRRPRRKGKPL